MQRNPKTIQTIIVGCIAQEMGLVNGKNLLKAGDTVFDFVSSLTHKELSELKKLKREKKVEDI